MKFGIFDEHRLPRPWDQGQELRLYQEALDHPFGTHTPGMLRAHLRTFADVGVDPVIFIQQGGRNRHEHICESLELFAAEVMPEFTRHEAERERAKAERLGPAIAAALARKQFLRAPTDDEIQTVAAYGRNIVETPAR